MSTRTTRYSNKSCGVRVKYECNIIWHSPQSEESAKLSDLYLCEHRWFIGRILISRGNKKTELGAIHPILDRRTVKRNIERGRQFFFFLAKIVYFDNYFVKIRTRNGESGRTFHKKTKRATFNLLCSSYFRRYKPSNYPTFVWFSCWLLQLCGELFQDDNKEHNPQRTRSRINLRCFSAPWKFGN